MKIHTSTQPKEAAGAHITALLKKYADIPVLLMLSGGSAREVLEYISLENIDSTLSMSLIDERLNVPDEDSNAWQSVQTPWYQSIKKRGAHSVALDDADLKKWKMEHPKGKIITLLGMGADGHTAGILPMSDNADIFNRLFLDTDNWVTEYVHEHTDNPFKERLTVTAKFLITEVDDIIMYAFGEEKCKRLKSLETEYMPHIEPINILTRLQKVALYTDCREI